MVWCMREMNLLGKVIQRNQLFTVIQASVKLTLLTNYYVCIVPHDFDFKKKWIKILIKISSNTAQYYLFHFIIKRLNSKVLAIFELNLIYIEFIDYFNSTKTAYYLNKLFVECVPEYVYVKLFTWNRIFFYCTIFNWYFLSSCKLPKSNFSSNSILLNWILKIKQQPQQ